MIAECRGVSPQGDRRAAIWTPRVSSVTTFLCCSTRHSGQACVLVRNLEAAPKQPRTEDAHADPHRRRAALVCRAQAEGRDRGQPWRGHADLGAARTRRQRRARAFAAKGVKPGDFVAIGLPNGNTFFETTFAVWKCGATPTSLSWRLPRGEAAAVLEILKPALVVGGEADWNAPNSLPADFVPEGMSDEPLEQPGGALLEGDDHQAARPDGPR